MVTRNVSCSVSQEASVPGFAQIQSSSAQSENNIIQRQLDFDTIL